MSGNQDSWLGAKGSKRIGGLGEEYIIREVRKSFAETGSGDVILGIGDDAAAVKAPSGGVILVTTDTMVEGIHFTKTTITPEDLGWKVLATNVSDIASMGGRSDFAVISLGLTGEETTWAIGRIIKGLKKAAGKYKVAIVGGDTVRAGSLTITVALWGRSSKRGFLTRAGARVGDEIWVTGSLGGSHLGLSWMLSGRDPRDPAARSVVLKHSKPDPPADVFADLFDTVKLHSGCDLSDGVAIDLGHIVKESGVGALIVMDLLPVPRGAGKVGGILGIDPKAAALFGGEDYELLFTASPREAAKIEDFLQSRRVKAVKIGGIVERAKGFKVIGPDGPFVPDPKTAFQHFNQSAGGE